MTLPIYDIDSYANRVATTMSVAAICDNGSSSEWIGSSIICASPDTVGRFRSKHLNSYVVSDDAPQRWILVLPAAPTHR